MIIMSKESELKLQSLSLDIRKLVLDRLSYGGDPAIQRVVSNEAFELAVQSIISEKILKKD